MTSTLYQVSHTGPDLRKLASRPDLNDFEFGEIANVESAKTLSRKKSDETSLVFPSDLGQDPKNRHIFSITIYDAARHRKSATEATETTNTANTTIYLPLPPTTNQFSANWGTLATGFTGNKIMQAGRNARESINQSAQLMKEGTFDAEFKFLENIVKSVGGTTAENAVDFVKSLGLQGGSFSGIGQTALTGAGVAIRSFQAQQFSTMNFREFGFSWKFVASSSQETDTLREIEDNMKMAMHPSTTTSINTLLDYPSEFILQFLQCPILPEGDLGVPEENTYLPRIAPCVLTSLNFQYNPSVTSFFSETSAPVEIAISVSFRETVLITREDIKDGIYR